MNLDKNYTPIKKYIQAIQALAFSSSKKENDAICYAYAYGFSLADVHSMLERLDLTKSQLKELEKITNKLVDDTI